LNQKFPTVWEKRHMVDILNIMVQTGWSRLIIMAYRIYSRISRKIYDKIMPQKLGGRLIRGS